MSCEAAEVGTLQYHWEKYISILMVAGYGHHTELLISHITKLIFSVVTEDVYKYIVTIMMMGVYYMS